MMVHAFMGMTVVECVEDQDIQIIVEHVMTMPLTTVFKMHVAFGVAVDLMKMLMEYVMISTTVLDNMTSVGFVMAQVLRLENVIVMAIHLTPLGFVVVIV